MIQELTNYEKNNFMECEENNAEISAELYRCVFDIAGDAIFFLDKGTGQIIEANQAAEKMYGYSKKEFILLKDTDLFTEPEEAPSTLKTGFNHAQIIYHKKKDGTVFPVEISDAYIEQSGKIVSVVNIRDITCRLEAEHKILETNKELEQLIYVTSHDFRTPLLNINGYSSELKSMFFEIKKIVSVFNENEKSAELSKYFNEDVPEAFTYIDDSCKKINTLIEDLLKVSRLRKVK